MRIPFSSIRASVGWIFSAALALLLLSLLVLPPAARELSAFVFPRRLAIVAADGKSMGVLMGEPADFVGAYGWRLPPTYRYRLVPDGEAAAGDVEILATNYLSPRTDARKFPELYATCAWRSQNESDPNWAARSTQHSDGPDRAWLQIDDWQGAYLVTRIGLSGNCTSTAEQVSHRKLNELRLRPWSVLSWPFSARPESDQRAVWVRMTVNKRVDGEPRSGQDTARLWDAVLSAFGEQVRQTFK